MTRFEFKSIRHGLDISTQVMAHLLRVSDGRTVRRWESGERDIPGPAQVLMRLLERRIITVADIEGL